MIVVADTTPLNYLIQMRIVSILENLYERVYLPNAVAEEMQHYGAPADVQRWIVNAPAWVTVLEAPKTNDLELLKLDLGEQQAIILVKELNANLLLVDDLLARNVAERRGIRITGTLGILRDAANAGSIDFEEKAAELMRLGFRTTSYVLAQTRADLN